MMNSTWIQQARAFAPRSKSRETKYTKARCKSFTECGVQKVRGKARFLQFAGSRSRLSHRSLCCRPCSRQRLFLHLKFKSSKRSAERCLRLPKRFGGVERFGVEVELSAEVSWRCWLLRTFWRSKRSVRRVSTLFVCTLFTSTDLETFSA